MTDYDQIVGSIRAQLQSPDRTDDPRLAKLAAEYSAGCVEANERLNRCGFFLRQGLRSQAIHLSRTAPDLLGLVALLDFPERAEWDDLALTYGWPKAPALAIEFAEALNSAYAEEQPLEELLRSHRRLALERAPLSARLEVMRSIAGLDPNNPIWAEDIRGFEQARFEQIENEIRIAGAPFDTPTAEEILQELETVEWTVPPPEPLLIAAHEAALKAKRAELCKNLGSLLEPLHKAMAAKDVELGRTLRARWDSLLDESLITRSDPLVDQAQAVFDWLDRQERREAAEREHDEAILELTQALDEGEGRSVLAALEQAALHFERGLPKALKERLRTRYQEIARWERRRNWAILSVGVAVLLGFLGIVAWSNAKQDRLREIRLAADKLNDLLASGKVAEARAVLEEVEKSHPGANASPDLEPATSRLVAAEREERERQAEFWSAIADARNAPLNQDELPALKTAQTLARLSAEKTEVEKLTQMRRALLNEERTKVDAKLLPRLEELSRKIEQAEAQLNLTTDAAKVQAVLNSLTVELPSLKAEAAGAGERAQGEVLACVARIEKIVSARTANLERDRMLEQLTRAVGTLNRADELQRYVDLWKSYAAASTGEPGQQSPRITVEEQALWHAALVWGAMVREWPSPLTTVSPKEAQARLDPLVRFQGAKGQFRDQGGIAGYQAYLKSVASRAAKGDENAASPIRRLLANPLVRDIWMIEALNGQAHYSLKPPKLGAAGYQFSGLVSIDCREKPVFIHRSNFLATGRAPQSQVANRITPMIERALESPTSWDSTMTDILQAIRSEPKLDPILKVILLKGAIQSASQGSAPLGETLKPHARLIDEAQLNLDVAWVDPEDKGAELERKRTLSVLGSLPPFPPCQKEAEAERQRLEQQLSLFYWPIGLLIKDQDGTWRCLASAKELANLDLFVIAPSGDWKKIGKGKDQAQETSIDQTAQGLLEGRLVFVQRRAS